MEAFVWSIICTALFVIGFIIIFHTADGLTKSLQTISQKFKFHPLILTLIVLSCDPRITIISCIAALKNATYLSISTIIGSCIISLTLSLALPLILFRADPFLKLMAANLEKDEKSKIPPFYFKLLCLSSLMFVLPLIPSIASYSYNLLLIALINIVFFVVYITKNFLKYRKTQIMDIYIEPLATNDNATTNTPSKEAISPEEKDKLRTEEDVCYDNDTDDYDARQSSKEDYDEILGPDEEDQPDEKMNIMDADEIELGKIKTSAVSTKDNDDTAKLTKDGQIKVDMEISRELGINLDELRNGGYKKLVAVVCLEF